VAAPANANPTPHTALHPPDDHALAEVLDGEIGKGSEASEAI